MRLEKTREIDPPYLGRLVASACKSSNPQEAAIIIWDTQTWKQVPNYIYISFCPSYNDQLQPGK